MITLYTMQSSSPNILKISMMLKETGLPYTVKRMEKQNNGHLPVEFLAINPNATVPAILDQDNGAIIFESGAILHYLAEKSGKYLPADLITRGEALKWLMFEVANMGPTMGELFYYMLHATDEIADIHLQRYKDKVAQFCTILDHQLDGRKFLCGEFTIADIALYPWCAVLEDMADVNLCDYPKLENWAFSIGKRPAAMVNI
ncbi:MAG TPA: glutathione S-transferase family protein [Gallionellaceae bacterium]|nr:glutathione S-transferase family protein [Gallionellaceae bacterium]